MATEVDLIDDGVLFMINTVLFHPRGFALAQECDGSLSLIGSGQERWVFAERMNETQDNDAKWAAFNDLLARQAKSYAASGSRRWGRRR